MCHVATAFHLENVQLVVTGVLDFRQGNLEGLHSPSQESWKCLKSSGGNGEVNAAALSGVAPFVEVDFPPHNTSKWHEAHLCEVTSLCTSAQSLWYQEVWSKDPKNPNRANE